MRRFPSILLSFALWPAAFSVLGQAIPQRTGVINGVTYSFPGTPPGGSWQGWLGVQNPAFIQNDTLIDTAYTIPVNPCTAFAMPTDGVSDCSPALQSCLTAAVSGEIITFPFQGTFVFKSAVHWPNSVPNVAINLNASSLAYSPTAASPTLFTMSYSAGANTFGQLVVTNNIGYGSNIVIVNLNAGPNTPCYSNLVYQHSFVVPGYVTNLCLVLSDIANFQLLGRHGWGNGNLLNAGAETNEVAQIVHITSIVTNGNSVVFTTEKPICWNFTNHPCAYPIANPIYGAGIENGTITDLNTNDAGQSVAMIGIGGAYNCWVKNIQFIDTPSGAVWMGMALNCTVQDCKSRYHTHVNSGESYIYEFQGPCTSDNVDNSSGWGGRHTFIGQGPRFMCFYRYCVAYGDNNYTESPNWGTQAMDGHGGVGVYDGWEDCLLSHGDLGSLIHNQGEILGVAYGDVFNHDMTNDLMTPWFIAETNIPVPLGQSWSYGHGLPYTQDLQGLSIEASNSFNTVINCQLDTHTILNYPSAKFFGPGAGPWDLEFGAIAEDNTFHGDLSCSNNTLLDANWSYIRGSNTWLNGAHAVSNSISLAAAPGWWTGTWPFYLATRTLRLDTNFATTMPAIRNYFASSNGPAYGYTGGSGGGPAQPSGNGQFFYMH